LLEQVARVNDKLHVNDWLVVCKATKLERKRNQKNEPKLSEF
jgi:hypothetical protein